MAGFNEKIRLLIVALVLVFSIGAFGQGSDDGTFAVLTNFKLPDYDESGKLRFILYGEKGVNLGEIVNLEGVQLDMVRNDIKSVEDVKDMKDVKPYPIKADTEEILKFWLKYNHSTALIYTPKAVFDKMTRIIRGNEEIHFRSPIMDLDGVGFEADYNTKILIVKKNVRVIIRAGAQDAKKNEELHKKSEPEKKKSGNNDKVTGQSL